MKSAFIICLTLLLLQAGPCRAWRGKQSKSTRSTAGLTVQGPRAAFRWQHRRVRLDRFIRPRAGQRRSARRPQSISAKKKKVALRTRSTELGSFIRRSIARALANGSRIPNSMLNDPKAVALYLSRLRSQQEKQKEQTSRGHKASRRFREVLKQERTHDGRTSRGPEHRWKAGRGPQHIPVKDNLRTLSRSLRRGR